VRTSSEKGRGSSEEEISKSVKIGSGGKEGKFETKFDHAIIFGIRQKNQFNKKLI
jgi:hypothetical protein